MKHSAGLFAEIRGLQEPSGCSGWGSESEESLGDGGDEGLDANGWKDRPPEEEVGGVFGEKSAGE